MALPQQGTETKHPSFWGNNLRAVLMALPQQGTETADTRATTPDGSTM